MSDIADLADQPIQHAIDDGIAKARRELSTVLIPVGMCHWCESPLPAGKLFCPDDSCDVDWQHNQERRRATGQ